MQLKEYPQAIAKAETKLMKLNQEIEIQSQLLSYLDAEIEKSIALDKDLKNEQQRKSKRLELQQSPDYLEIKTNLKEAKDNKDEQLITIKLLINQFSVAKLEAKSQIAGLELALN